MQGTEIKGNLMQTINFVNYQQIQSSLKNIKQFLTLETQYKMLK